MKRLFFTSLCVLSSLLALGCSSGSTDPTPAKQCNDLAHGGDSLTLALASNPPPDPTGGTISDGDYVLTAARLFKVPSSVDFVRKIGITIKVKGNVLDRVSVIDGKTTHDSFTYSISGTTLELSPSCSSTKAETHTFIATSSQFELITPEPGTDYTMNLVFSKR